MLVHTRRPRHPSPLAAAWASAFASVDAVVAPDEGTTATAVLAWRPAGSFAGGLAVQAANVGDSAAILLMRSPGSGSGGGSAGGVLDPAATAGLAPASSSPTSPANPSRRFSEGGDVGSDARAPAPRYSVIPLTADHRLTSAAERARLAAEGVVLGGGGTRLYGLNLSRCLGDASLKAGEGWGLSGAPAVSGVHWVPPGEAALVVAASDGVWDVMSARRVAAVAAGAAAAAPDGERAVAAATAVVALAVRRHARDDVTCAVAVLRPPALAGGGGGGGGCGAESEGAGGGGGEGSARDGGESSPMASSSPPVTPRAAATAR